MSTGYIVVKRQDCWSVGCGFESRLGHKKDLLVKQISVTYSYYWLTTISNFLLNHIEKVMCARNFAIVYEPQG